VLSILSSFSSTAILSDSVVSEFLPSSYIQVLSFSGRNCVLTLMRTIFMKYFQIQNFLIQLSEKLLDMYIPISPSLPDR